jgi:hypothetical protein
MEEWELRGRADSARARSRGEPVGALPFSRRSARGVRHLDEDRDPVALGDRLTELAHGIGS